MADDQEPMPEEIPAQEGAPQELGEAPAEAASEGAAAQEAVAEAKPAAGLGFFVSLAFVGLAAIGIFSYAADKPAPWMLGLGLLGWGVMDLLGQRRQFSQWKGNASAMINIMGAVRGVFFSVLGLILVISAFGGIKEISANTILVASVSFIAAYFIAAYTLELSTQNRAMMPHALLLAALSLQFVSFLYFTLPFTVSWAGVFALLSFSFLTYAVWRGVMKASPSVAPSVGLLTLLLGAPFSWFFAQEVVLAELQPVHQSTLFMPRYFELKGKINRYASSVSWAPGNTQPGLPGEIPYSDKIALIDERDGQKLLSIFVQKEKGAAFSEMPLSEKSDRPWWSPDSRRLAATGREGAKERGTLSLYTADSGEAKPKKEGGLEVLKGRKTVLAAQDAMPHDRHGQIWSPNGKDLYYAGPKSGRKKGRTAIWRADSSALEHEKLTKAPSKIYPAASPDGTKILYVVEKENVRYLQIGDTEAGLNSRTFRSEREKHLFPAWNKEQTQVLFWDANDNELKIMSANNKADAQRFSQGLLRSRVWKAEESGDFFTLEVKDTGAKKQIWHMNTDGTRKKMLYETVCSELWPPTWSPDSSRVLAVERDGKIFTLFTFGRDGEWPRRFFVTRDAVRELSWSQDSARVGWITQRAKGGSEVWVAEKNSLSPEKLASSKGELSSLSWSPFGQHLAWEEKRAWTLLGIRFVRPDVFKTWVYDIKTLQLRSLTVGGTLARQPAFSPQGVMIAYITDQASTPWFPGVWSLKLSPKRPGALAVVQLF